MDETPLERFERLPAIAALRATLKAAMKLELVVTSAEGPSAHARGGVMAASSECCRGVLFSREGFGRCDAFYRGLGARDVETAGPCHLGLATVSVPVIVEGDVIAAVAASGFLATAISSVPPPDPARLARELLALDPGLTDAGELVRKLPQVRGDRVDVVRAILRVAAEEIADAELRERKRTRGRSEGEPGAFGILGQSPAMREVLELVRKVGDSEAAVLVLGESGTGKELVARAIHDHGARSKGPFVAQSCAAMSDEMLESALFGHVRGAFSGALRAEGGLFGAANGGTLFLDEVAEMSPAMQVKLLRVLSDGSYLPVGATSPRRADVRVIAATHRDLSALVAEGRFRQDLFYRLHVLAIRLPPLRERAGDLPLLLAHYQRKTPHVPLAIQPEAMRCLERYGWPGNVRELAAEVARWGVVAADEDLVRPEHLSPEVRDAGGFARARQSMPPPGPLAAEPAPPAATGEPEGTLAQAVEALERGILERGLARTGGNRTQLARELDISRTTLNERLKRYGLG
ncbi:MAG: sigma 54-interacting transcriptional regulator [Sandaracinus sp.]